MFRGGGVQECVLALREGIVKRGHKAFIITPQPRDYSGPKVPGLIMIGGSTEFKTFFATSADVSASVDNDALEQMLAAEKFDVLHFHEPWNPILSRQIMSRSDAINIGTFHAALPERMMTKTIERVITPYTSSVIKYLDVMTAVSPAATKYVSTLTKRRINIIANGIDLDKYRFQLHERDDQNNTKIIFYIGRLEKRKGLKYLLEAFRIVQTVHHNYKLIIAGDGPDKNKLQEIVAEKGIQNVKFLGFIDEKTKTELFHQADVFCSPALYGESFGIVLLEAMASGCVVVAGNNSGYENVLKGTGQISLINPKDSKEFARRLLLMASDKGLREHWLNWAKNEIPQYDYDKIIDQYVALYEAAYRKKYPK